jgi:hypothetical protein
MRMSADNKSIRLILFLVAILVATLVFVSAELSFNPFATKVPTARSWYVELSVPARPVAMHNEFLVTDLARELAQIHGVRKVLSSTMRTKVVLALLLDANTDAHATESAIRFATERLLDAPANGFADQSRTVVLSKPVGRPLRGIKGLDPRTAAGLSNELLLQAEFSQLFGYQSPYDESLGILDLVAPDIRVTIQVKSDDTGMHGNLISRLKGIGPGISLMPAVQLAVVRNLPMRIFDLRYSGLDALRLGLSANEIARRAYLLDEPQGANVRQHASRSYLFSSESPELLRMLARPISSVGPEQIRLGEIAQVTAKPAFLTGELNVDPAQWRERVPVRGDIERIRMLGDGAELSGRSFQQADIDILLSNEDAIHATVAALTSLLEPMKRADPAIDFRVENRSSDNNDFTLNQSGATPLFASKWNGVLLISFFIVALLMPLLPSRLPGVRFLSCFAISGFLFCSLAEVTKLDLSLERLATATGLFFIFGFSRELPVARSNLALAKKRIQSERIHQFLLLLTLPVLFSIYVLQFNYSWSERQHLLTFCLAALSVFLALTLYQPRAPGSVKQFGDQDFSARSWWMGGVCLIPMIVPLFEARIFTIDPPGLVLFGSVELDEGAADSEARIGKIKQHLLSHSGSDSLEYDIATSTFARELSVRSDNDSPQRVSPEVLEDILSASKPIYARNLLRVAANGESSSESENIMIRLIDRDFNFGSVSDPFSDWIERAVVPASMTLKQGDPGQSTAAVKSGEFTALRELVHLEQRQVLVREMRSNGKPIFLFTGRGVLNGPTATPAEEVAVMSRITASLHELGIEASDRNIVTNVLAHSQERNKTTGMTWIISLLVLGTGALFFGSVKGALQTYFTYLLSYGIAKPVMIFVYTYSGMVYLVSDLELQIAAMSMSLGLLSIWGHVSSDTNESRKGNLTLERAFIPFFYEANHLHKVLMGTWSIIFLLALSYQPLRFLSGVIFCTVVALLMFPRWVLFWAVLDEYLHRWYLRLRIKFLSFDVVGFFNSYLSRG